MNKKKLKLNIEAFQETSIADEYKNLEFSIVLVQPEHSGNIGSIARTMKNFNFQNLIIFNPIEEVLKIKSYETQGFAMHGKEILINSEIITIENQVDHFKFYKAFMGKFDLVIATTAKGKHYRNVKRLSIFPENLELPISKRKISIALVFGKESRGLTNQELEIADILVRIPTGAIYPTLNLSHACSIILYEIFKQIHTIQIGRGINPVLLADKEDRIVLYNHIKELIRILKVRTHREENVYHSFKNVFERSLISKKELSLIMGVFSKVKSILKQSNLYI